MKKISVLLMMLLMTFVVACDKDESIAAAKSGWSKIKEESAEVYETSKEKSKETWVDVKEGSAEAYEASKKMGKEALLKVEGGGKKVKREAENLMDTLENKWEER